MDEDHKLISLDVVSLFTNVPTELIGISIVRKWNHISHNTKIPMEKFITAVSMIIDSTFVTFNNKYYKQIFGNSYRLPAVTNISDTII